MYSNETYSKVRIGKHLSDSFHIQGGLKQGDAVQMFGNDRNKSKFDSGKN
jgi:hypothetical protein